MGRNLAACQILLNQFVLVAGFLCGVVIKSLVLGPIAYAAASDSTPLVSVNSDANGQTVTGLAATDFLPDVPTGDGEEPVSAEYQVEPVPSSGMNWRQDAEIAASTDKHPLKDAGESLPADVSLVRELPFAELAEDEDSRSASLEEAIAPPLALPTADSRLPASVPSAAGLSGDGRAVWAQVPETPENGELPPPVAPIEDFQPLLQFQAATLFQEDELSGRLRASALYALNEQVLFGATVDLVGGNAFVDAAAEGLTLNELYVAAAPFHEVPNLRFVGGLIDLSGYLDRNSFAKDVVTHFFHPVFQTNPALSAAGIGSRPGLLVNWSATDDLDIKVTTFSSSRDLGDLALDGFAAEAGFRTGNLIIRGTFATDRDADDDTGFAEIFQIQRGDGSFGPREDDREVAYGINAEYFIDAINLGLFGRYGWYENQDVSRSGVTFSFGANALDVFLTGDRLGLGYGQQLSNGDLRSGKTPDVWELFYDAPVYSQVRVGVSLQSRDEFSDTGLGFRVRADW